MNRFKLFSLLMLLLLAGCAATGPSIIKAYDVDSPREEIAIVRVDPKAGLSITGIDQHPVSWSAKYVLLQPGRHELYFNLTGSTFFTFYQMNNKKYIDAEAGHTYVLKSKGVGLFDAGDKWFPEITDVTNDPALHISTIPKEEKIK